MTANVTPASPAMLRALLMINRAFSNPWAREKSMCRTMMHIGPRHAAARARYGDIAATMAQHKFGLTAAILHLRFGRKLHPHSHQRARYLEALLILRFLRRRNPHQYYWVRDALTATTAVGEQGLK